MIVIEDFKEMGQPIINFAVSFVIDTKPKNIKKLHKIVIPKNITSNIRYLTVPIHRFASSLKVIILDNDEYSIYRLFITIYQFYNEKEISYEDLKNINDDDVYDYVTKIVIKKRTNPELKIYYIDIMGDKTHFETIYNKTDNSGDIQYYLLLGS